jgi:hypothetical protein
VPEQESKKLKFIGCEIIRREACHLTAKTPHRVHVEFLVKGLHDLETPEMLTELQRAVDRVDAADGFDAIILGYARCNDGLVGLTARDVPLVIPRAHDCITFFFGSRENYKEYFDAFPGTYYMTTGWAECGSEGELTRPAHDSRGVMAKLGLTDSYEQMVEKYGKENADFIRQTLGDWRENYSKMLYLAMGVCDEHPYIENAERLADERNWSFELRKGDWTLLEKLFYGKWDDDFVIVPPGRSVEARNDEMILDVSDASPP